MIRHANDEGAHLISNAVTDEANEMSEYGIEKTYLQVTGEKVSFHEEYKVEVKVYSIHI